MQAIIAKSFAKINLLLNITGQRADGYHLLDGVMIPVSIYDTIRVAKSDMLAVSCAHPAIPSGSKNTAFKIAQAFFAHTGIKGGADIFIQKRIPHEAGLGGGSANAACVLRALDALYETHLGLSALTDIASQNGADIAFFLREGAQRAQGIGEILEPVGYAFSYPIVIIKPFGGVNTPAAFKLFHQTLPQAADVGACILALEHNDIQKFAAASRNMLQTAGISLCPAIGDAIAALYQEGALFAQMTGSGSAVYAFFADEAMARQCVDSIASTGLFEYAGVAGYSATAYAPILEIC